MQIKDYITKNFPSLNWNILPQIFAENGIEMNEEIEAYLRNTPENTNWSILEQLGGSGSEIELPAKIVCNDGVYTGQLPEGSSWETTAEAFNWIKQHGDSSGSFTVIDISVVALIDSQGKPFDGKDSGTGRIFDDRIVWSTRNYSIELNQNALSVWYQD